jgi:hypothetical protein
LQGATGGVDHEVLVAGIYCGPLSPGLRQQAPSEAIALLAVAHGHRAPPGEEPSPVQFVLFFDTDLDALGYYTFDTINKEIEAAVLMRGDGTRYLSRLAMTRYDRGGPGVLGGLYGPKARRAPDRRRDGLL